MALDRDDHALHELDEIARPSHAWSPPVQPLRPLPAYCIACSLHETCRPGCHNGADGAGGPRLASTNRMILRGESLFRGGDLFRSLYIIRSGCFKTVQSLEGGRDQVTGFYMGGDMLGFEGICSGAHRCDAVALEDSNVCVIPYARLETLEHAGGGVMLAVLKAMSAEIVQERRVMLLLGLRSAEERLANFLVALSQRLLARGYSPSEFNLRMTRRDIGSFLGLKFETVSRIFSRFRDEGLIDVKLRHVRIQDLAGLRRLANVEADALLPLQAGARNPLLMQLE